MALETVVDDIREEAREEAEQLLQEAEEESESILERAREEAEEIREREEERAEHEAEEIVDQTVSSARLDARKMESEAEKEALSDLRSEVEDRLRNLEDGREELTEELLSAAVEELDSDGGTVFAAEGDQELVEDLLDDYDGYEYGGEADVLGGAVVEAEEGDVRVDNSFDGVLDRVWNDELKQISGRLLGEG